MKNIFKAATLLFCITLCSCEDRLDIKPKGKIILTSVEEYAALLDTDTYLRYSNDVAWKTCFDAGMAEPLVTGSNTFTKISHLGLLDEDRTIDYKSEQLYTKCYERIARYNIIIDDIMDAKGSEDGKVRTRAEALVLRAYNHFILLNTFCKHYNAATAESDGGIMLRKRFSLEEMPAQASVAEAYRFIENDLNAAIPHLESKGMNVNHPGLAFAYAVLAKVHLFKQEFAKAETAAKESLKHNSFIFDWVAWDNGPKPAPEIDYSCEENLYFGYGMNSQMPNGFSIGPRLVAKYTAGDLRKDRFFWDANPALLPGCNSFRPYAELVNGANVSRSIKFNIGGMKVSEVMLMLAECYARSGKVTEAMGLVNDLRKKRVLPASYADLTASNKEEAFQHVMDERSRELVLTPNNFYDIRRLEVEGIHQSVERVISNGDKYVVKSDAHIFVIPFPQDAIIRNNTLTQNVVR